MTINIYAKKWVEEDYDMKNEAFYLENAKWMIERIWITGCIKRGIKILLFATIYGAFSSDIATFISNTLFALTPLSIAEFFYLIRKCEADPCSGIMYFASLILCFITKPFMVGVLLMPFQLIGMLIFAYIVAIRPIIALKQKKIMKQKMEEMENFEEEQDKKNYSKWEYEYNSYRNCLMEHRDEITESMMKEASELFEGYTSTRTLLKSRYHQLAKEYHPDCGGDEKRFQCISCVYEKLITEL